jgi:hypothetical protein
MRQTCGRDNFIGGIGLKVQHAKIQAHLARNGPDMDLVHRGGEGLMVEAIGQPSQLMQFRDLPQDDGRDAPFRIVGEDVSLAWCETSLERFDQNMSVQIQHAKQLQSKRDRLVDSTQGLS